MKKRIPAPNDVGVRLPDGVQKYPVKRKLTHVEANELCESQPGVGPRLSEVTGEDQHLLVVLDRTQGGHSNVDLDPGDLVLHGTWPHLVVVLRGQQMIQHPTHLPHGLIPSRNA